MCDAEHSDHPLGLESPCGSTTCQSPEPHPGGTGIAGHRHKLSHHRGDDEVAAWLKHLESSPQVPRGTGHPQLTMLTRPTRRHSYASELSAASDGGPESGEPSEFRETSSPDPSATGCPTPSARTMRLARIAAPASAATATTAERKPRLW
jgi:hypothetical protein